MTKLSRTTEFHLNVEHLCFLAALSVHLSGCPFNASFVQSVTVLQQDRHLFSHQRSVCAFVWSQE